METGQPDRHPQFGDGTIINLEGSVAQIKFDYRGAKTLNLAFAPLEKA